MGLSWVDEEEWKTIKNIGDWSGLNKGEAPISGTFMRCGSHQGSTSHQKIWSRYTFWGLAEGDGGARGNTSAENGTHVCHGLSPLVPPVPPVPLGMQHAVGCATSSREEWSNTSHFHIGDHWISLGRNEVSMDIGDASGVVLAQNITAVVDPILTDLEIITLSQSEIETSSFFRSFKTEDLLRNPHHFRLNSSLVPSFLMTGTGISYPSWKWVLHTDAVSEARAYELKKRREVRAMMRELAVHDMGVSNGFYIWVCLKIGYTPNEIAI